MAGDHISLELRRRRAIEIVRDMRTQNARSRERVLRSVARLYEIADAKRRSR